jgi:hypothetical protein
MIYLAHTRIDDLITALKTGNGETNEFPGSTKDSAIPRRDFTA